MDKTLKALKENQIFIAVLYAVSFPVTYGISMLGFKFLFPIYMLFLFLLIYALYPVINTTIFVGWFKLKYFTMFMTSVIMILIMILFGLRIDGFFFNHISRESTALGIFVSSQIGYGFGKLIQNSRAKSKKRKILKNKSDISKDIFNGEK